MSLLLTLACAHAATAAAKPNIMFILADDLGYNELNFMNGTRGIMTENLDKLANAGVILKNYYVQPICSPTRSALMTGRYTIRLGTQANVIFWDTPWGVPVNETFVPQNMKDAGYDTAMFGKWHLGMFKQDYTPARRGFDEHMGYYQGCESAWTHVSACCSAGSPDHDNQFICESGKWGAKDYRAYDWFKTGPAPNNHTSQPDFSANETNSAYLIRDATIDFLGRHSNTNTNNNAAGAAPAPWFLYLPFQNIHGPYTTDVNTYQQYLDANGTNGHTYTADEVVVFGYLTEMDVAIGKIVAKVDEIGATDNTIYIFSSDNGAPGESPDVNHAYGPNKQWIARNYPFRGQKTQIWEGGTRVAGFISSPLLPKAIQGTISDKLFHVTDWLPTIVAFAGGTTKRNFELDGHDMMPALTGTAPDKRTEILYGLNPLPDGQAAPPKAALRMGDYKVLCWNYDIAGINGKTVTQPVNSPSNSTKGSVAYDFVDGCALYDLASDPAETTNVAKKNDRPHKKMGPMLARLKVLADQSVYPLSWTPPFQGPDYFCKDCPLAPVYGPTTPGSPWL